MVAEKLAPQIVSVIGVLYDGNTMLPVTKTYAIPHETSDQRDLIFSVPHGKNMLLLGGLIEPHKWSTNISFGDGPPIWGLLARYVEVLPVLKHVRIDRQELVRADLCL